MRVVDVGQRTSQWHEWRRGGVSASNAAVILGSSPFKTPWRLWGELRGVLPIDDLSRNPWVRHGIVHEPYARSRVYQELAPAWAELESDLQGFGSGAVHLQHKSQRLKLILLVKLADLVTEGGTELVLFSQEDDEQGVTLDAKKITSMFMVPNPSPGSDDELYLEALEALGVIAKRLNLQAIFADTDVPTGVWF